MTTLDEETVITNGEDTITISVDEYLNLTKNNKETHSGKRFCPVHGEYEADPIINIPQSEVENYLEHHLTKLTNEFNKENMSDVVMAANRLECLRLVLENFKTNSVSGIVLEKTAQEIVQLAETFSDYVNYDINLNDSEIEDEGFDDE